MKARTPLSPVGAAVRGAIAGAAGTTAMDLVWYARYRKGGGKQDFPAWELSSGVTWEDAPAPAQAGKRLAEGFLQRPLPAGAAPITNNVMHWGFGTFWGAVYGVVVGSMAKPKPRYGLVLGSAVWSFGYAVFPLGKLYKPIWEYDFRTLAKDLSAHVVFGAATGVVFRVLAGGHRRPPAGARTSPIPD